MRLARRAHLAIDGMVSRLPATRCLARSGAIAVVLLWLLLELLPSFRHSSLVFRGRDLLLSWMEDCTAVDATRPTTVAATFIAAHVANAEAHTGVMEGSGAQQCRQHHIKSSRPPGRGAAPTHKYFVYDVPSKFTSELLDVEVDVRQTTMEELERRALGAEIVFHKFLLDDVSGRTTSDPDQAALFFVPFYASSSRTASRLATANLYRQLKTHLRASAPYWDRYGGHDHVFVLGRHYTERTAFGRDSMDLVLHDTPIFLTFELTNYKMADLSSHMWHMARNVIMPRPDPFAHLSSPHCPDAGVPSVDAQRPYLVAYIGSQISEFRRRLVAVLQEPHTNNLSAPSVVNNEAYVSAFCRDERLAMAEASRHGKTIARHDSQPIPVVYRMADFCPCPRGDANSDSRMYDAIRAGCIPVLFTSMRMHAFEDRIDYAAIVVTAEWVATKADVRLLLEQLRAMPEAEKAARRRAMLEAVPLLSFDTTLPINAFTLVLDEALLRARVLNEYRTHYGKTDKFPGLMAPSTWNFGSFYY